MPGCREQDSTTRHSQAVKVSETTYTCSMHPQIRQNKPGNCPVCGMTLVEASDARSTNELMLTETQMRLANITTQRAGKRPVGETIVFNGKLSVDESRSRTISSRAAGRIEKLFIKENGQSVAKGQPLYVLYSESLLTLQQEYLLAKEQYESVGKNEARYKSFLDAAERKLLLYGLTKIQLKNLNRNRLEPRITFLSPANGIVTEIETVEGQYIEEGTLLYTLEDISTLWVEAELYPDEGRLVKQGDKIIVKIAGFESSPLETKVTFLSPEYRPNTQILTMRAEIKNPGLRYKVGQQAQVYFTNSSHQSLALPVDAVIRDGKGSHVYLQTGHQTFLPKMVKTGLEGFDHVEIVEGLNEGDMVAVTGAYLLYSEIILKRGGDPMAGHNH